MAAVVFYRQGLTGGAASDLDEKDGADLNDGDAAFVMTGSAVYNYRLDASSGAAESSPNTIAPDTNAGSKRWLLQAVQNVQTPEYSNITTSTTLAVAMTYNDSSGTNTHTLPLLSGTSAGERIELYISGADRTVIINHNASDSSGAEIWTGYAIGDHVTLVSNGSAWMVADEKISVNGLVSLTSDDAISGTTLEKVFDAGYSEDSDIGGWWNASTHRIEADFDCLLNVNMNVISNYDFMIPVISVSGTPVQANITYQQPVNGTFQIELTSGQYVELYCYNFHGVSHNVMGDAAKDETFATWNLIKRIR